MVVGWVVVGGVDWMELGFGRDGVGGVGSVGFGWVISNEVGRASWGCGE